MTQYDMKWYKMTKHYFDECAEVSFLYRNIDLKTLKSKITITKDDNGANRPAFNLLSNTDLQREQLRADVIEG